MRRIQWPRALTLWGCAGLFATGMGWAVTVSHTLERVFWVGTPAVAISGIAWLVSYNLGDDEFKIEDPIARARITHLEMRIDRVEICHTLDTNIRDASGRPQAVRVAK